MSVTSEETDPHEFAVEVPGSWVGDLPVAFAYWRKAVTGDGWAPAGEPRLVKRDPVAIVVDGRKSYPFGDDPGYAVIGPVKRTEPLPVFVPSQATVEAAAKALGATINRDFDWETTPAHVKNTYAHMALAVFSKAGHQVVADALRYTEENHAAHGGLTSQDRKTLTALAAMTEERVSPDQG